MFKCKFIDFLFSVLPIKRWQDLKMAGFSGSPSYPELCCMPEKAGHPRGSAKVIDP